MIEKLMGDSYDLEAEAYGRSRGDNERLLEQQISDGGRHSILDRVIAQQCEQEARSRSLGQNVDICISRDSQRKPTSIVRRVIYEQLRRLFSR